MDFSAVKPERLDSAARRGVRCGDCGGTDFDGGDDGFFYCRDCGGQTQDMMETECLEDDMFGAEGAMYNVKFTRHSQSRQMSLSQSQSQPQSKSSKEELLRSLARNLGSSVKEEDNTHGFDDEIPLPVDFAQGLCSNEKVMADKIRLRYVQGMQLIIQMQCKELVEKFGVSSLISGIVGEVWLRFLAVKKVFDDSWADKAILEAEASAHERRKDHTSEEDGADGSCFLRRKPIYVWVSSLRRMIPVHSSLAFVFLGCLVARETILPTDLVNWATEGKISYLTAFCDVEKALGNPGPGFPSSSRSMFRPVYGLGSWHTESTAGSIAESIGLHLPPVNFYAIARRYLSQLCLPVEEILQQTCRVYEWSMPAELWLSANPFRLPTRVCVVALVMVSMRILYDIHGHGVWEKSLSDPKIHSQEHPESSQLDARAILSILESKFKDLDPSPAHSKDLRSYLVYCKDVIFAGMSTTYEEERLIDMLWDIYDKQEAADSREPSDACRKRSRDKGGNGDETEPLGDPLAEMKRSMKEHGFEYISPRIRCKTEDYLHYRRKKVEGRLQFVAHADYFLLLRAFARLAEVDARIVHLGVLRLERRLRWLERRAAGAVAAFRRTPPSSSAVDPG
ncbi:TATA box-binding protein-associated factor RNA polymerase I subunit B-like [Wolffia australiana]